MSESRIKFHTPFNPPPKKPSPHGGKSLCDVSCLKDRDINYIVKRYNAGDRSMVRSNGVFADVSQIGDYLNCLEKVRTAQNDFHALPSAVRARFGHNPAELIAFLQDGNNRAEAVKLGLIKDTVTPSGGGSAPSEPPCAVENHLSINSASDTKTEEVKE